MKSLFLLLAISILTQHAHSQYQTKTISGGPFSRTIVGNYKIHENSSLEMKYYIINQSNSPIEITNLKTNLGFKDRQFNLKADLYMETSKNMMAFSYRLALYNVFGEHLTNLGGNEIQDLSKGSHIISAEWNSYSDLPDALNIVIFISKVRLADGKIWKASWADLAAEINKLKLEKFTNEEDETEQN